MRTFLDLPREIQGQVYDETWKTQTPFPTHLDRFPFYVGYKVTGTMSSVFSGGLPQCPWLAANKKLRPEAIEQFQRIAKWAYHSPIPVD